MSIPFTQYLRPDGRRTPVSVDRPADVEARAREVLADGGRFECEVLQDGQVALYAMRDDDELAIEVVENGPPVREAVDRLVLDAFEKLQARRSRS